MTLLLTCAEDDAGPETDRDESDPDEVILLVLVVDSEVELMMVPEALLLPFCFSSFLNA